MNPSRSFIWVFVGPALAIAAWWLIANTFVHSSALIPHPIATFQRFRWLFCEGKIATDVWATLLRSAAGYLLAGVAGVTLGVLMGSSRRVYRSSFLVVDFFRSVPITSLYPAFVWSLGIGSVSKIGMVFTACIFVIAVNTAHGIFNVSRARRDMAKLYGATSLQVFRWVSFREATPQIMVGLRIAISYALIVSIVCEMFMGSNFGLGQRITDAYTTFQVDSLYALVLLTGVLGLILNRLFSILESRVTAWSPR